jgi:hypothetical protein
MAILAMLLATAARASKRCVLCCTVDPQVADSCVMQHCNVHLLLFAYVYGHQCAECCMHAQYPTQTCSTLEYIDLCVLEVTHHAVH